MFVQALAQYADRCLTGQLEDESWESKPVPYFLEIDGSGKFLGKVHRMISVASGKKTVSIAEQETIPRSPVPRVAGLHPLLAADDVKYVLGPGAWTAKGQEENNQERHDAFVALIKRAAAETTDEALQACARFYDRLDEVELARTDLADAKPGSVVALSVNGPVVNRPAVRDYWQQHYGKVSQGRVAKGGDAECLISGRIGPIAPTHEKIKGLANLGGQSSGVALMSFDKEAFRSYGWEQNANSPVAADRAMAYVLALNDLLKRDGGHRKDIGGVGFIFWTKEPEETDLMGTIEQADEKQVKALLSLDLGDEPDPNMFYMAGVAGNGGRMLIRYWIAESLKTAKRNLQDWFNGLRVVNGYTGQPADPPRLWQLLNAIHREGKPPADRVIALIRRAIEGPSRPLGYRMLSAALTRLRAEKDKRTDAVRLGLIRLCLNDQLRNKGETLVSEALDLQDHHQAYLCGRLLAVYENLQRMTYRSAGETEVNVTVADRYYSLASSYPAIAFPKLETLGMTHLKKLRRSNFGAKVKIEKEITELHGAIAQASGFRFPGPLGLDGQGRFALGYYHQRAEQFKPRVQPDRANGAEMTTSEPEQES